MNDPKDLIEKILSTVQSAMPESLADDMKSNVRAMLQSSLHDLDAPSWKSLKIN